MTRDEIICLAREAGAVSKDGYQHVLQGDWFIEQFARLVSKAEREACAKEADKYAGCPIVGVTAQVCAADIRARREK